MLCHLKWNKMAWHLLIIFDRSLTVYLRKTKKLLKIIA
ncbi:hypothetical protein J479_1133 [Acinetobacter baumannii 1297]|nr:hypothetical protein J479_1133 [Acinetobacter baumannii 1297]